MRKLVVLALSLVGLFDSVLLWWVYTSPFRLMACLGTGCDVARGSSYAHFWGLPTPVFGVALYAALTLLIFAEALAGAEWARRSRFGIVGISGCGFLVSLYLSGVEAFVLRAWCVWCVVSALAVTAIFVLAMLDSVRPVPYPESAAQRAALRRYLWVVMAGGILSIPAFLFLSRAEAGPPLQQVSADVLEEHLTRLDNHSIGNLNSPVTVVEFGDFQCPFCGTSEKTVRKIREAYADRVRFVFRQFPLAHLHAYAQKSAEASECAADQGKFWEALEKFYDDQNDLTEPALKRYASELGLDMNRFNQCLSSGEKMSRIQRDLADGRAVGVDRTPTFFINQRQIVGGLDDAEFARLLDQELISRGVAAPQVATKPQDSTPPRPPEGSAPASSSAHPPSSASSDSGSLLGNPGSAIFSQAAGSAMACSEDEAKQKQPALIGTSEARNLFEDGTNALFVDVRTPQEFKRVRIPKAINLPVDEIERQFSRLPKGRNIILYEGGRSANPEDICAAGRAAGRFLLAHGYAPERVKVYRDGLAAWEKAGLPVEHASPPGAITRK